MNCNHKRIVKLLFLIIFFLANEVYGSTVDIVIADSSLLSSVEFTSNRRDIAINDISEMTIPQLFQADYTNVITIYEGEEKSVMSSGCGAVCLSMVLAYLRTDLQQSPETIFSDACMAGYYRGNGLSMAAINFLAQDYGIHVDYCGKSQGSVRKALTQGYPVIAYMDKGLFSNGGHYIVLRGLTQEGHIRVNDPNSREKSGKVYDLSLIVEQSKSGSPFLICKP